MNSSLLSLYGSSTAEGEAVERLFANLSDRAQCFERVAQAKGYDLVVLGGGLTGAVTAHQASLLGMRVLMLHESFFGSTAQLWSIGYRDLFRAPLLCRLTGARKVGATVDLFPTHLARSLCMTKARAALVDRWVWKLCRGAQPVPAGELPDCDGKAAIRETVLAARQEGAVCLSDVEISFVEMESGTGLYVIGVRDPMSEWRYEVRAGSVLLDPSSVRIPGSRLGRPVRPQSLDSGVYLRIVCRLLAPCSIKSHQVITGSVDGRDYLVYAASSSEIVEIVVPDTGKDTHQVIERICEYERLGASEMLFVGKFRQPRVQRHTLEQYGGLFSPRERGPWDAWLSAQQIIGELQRAANPAHPRQVQLVARELPGTLRAGEVEQFRAAALAANVPESAIAQSVKRWHGRVRYIPEFVRGFELVCPGVLRGEVELAYRSDQIATLEDLIFGALGLETDPQWREKIERVAAAFSEISGAALPPLAPCAVP